MSWGCVCSFSLLLGYCLGIAQAPSKIAASKLLSQDLRDNATFSLNINSELALFSIDNNTQGITITVTPLCSRCIPRSILFDGVYLPQECASVPCEHKLVKTNENQSTVEYVLGVPSILSVFLLQFQFGKYSHHFELVETMLVNDGIVGKYNCNPTAILQLDSFYALCVSENQLQVLHINNLGRSSFSDVNFSPATDECFHFSLPVTDLSSNLLANKIVLSTTSYLFVIDTFNNLCYSFGFSDCVSAINKVRLQNNTDAHDLSVIPYILYCDENYGVVDIADQYSDVDSFNYNDTGYPIICEQNGSTIANLTLTSGANKTLKFKDKTFVLPGRAISLQESVCFGNQEELYYLYNDLELGTILIDLSIGRPLYLSSQAEQEPIFKFTVYEDQYILLGEIYSTENVTVRVYYVRKKSVLFHSRVNHTSDLKQLIVLPKPQTGPDNKGLTIGLSVAAAVVIMLIAAIVALRLIIGYIRKHRNKRVDIGDTPLLKSIEVTPHSNEALPEIVTPKAKNTVTQRDDGQASEPVPALEQGGREPAVTLDAYGNTLLNTSTPLSDESATSESNYPEPIPNILGNDHQKTEYVTGK